MLPTTSTITPTVFAQVAPHLCSAPCVVDRLRGFRATAMPVVLSGGHVCFGVPRSGRPIQNIFSVVISCAGLFQEGAGPLPCGLPAFSRRLSLYPRAAPRLMAARHGIQGSFAVERRRGAKKWLGNGVTIAPKFSGPILRRSVSSRAPRERLFWTPGFPQTKRPHGVPGSASAGPEDRVRFII